MTEPTRHADVYRRLHDLLDPALRDYTAKGFSWPAATALCALDLDADGQQSAVELCVEMGWCDQAALNNPEDALRALLIDSPTLPPPGHSRWW
jgi:hypothetical protein